MSVPVSRRVQRVKPSPTLAVTARAARLKAEGQDIIGLGAGEPDFDTPAHIADAGVAAIRAGFTRYTAVEGINELKDAIIGKFKRDNALDYTRAQVLVSSGAKQTIYNLCAAILDPDDEAIIRMPLKELLGGLDPDVFWQVHRGVLVRVKAIDRVRKDELGRHQLSVKGRSDVLPVSGAF